jgi:hypothetical protein
MEVNLLFEFFVTGFCVHDLIIAESLDWLILRNVKEKTIRGMAEWAKHRTVLLYEVLKVERRTMPHHSMYWRILEEVICVEELEALVSEVWSGKRYCRSHRW